MKKKYFIAYLLLIVALILLWEFFARYKTVRFLMSSPVHVFDYFRDQFKPLMEATWVTFYEAVLGLLLAVGVSFLTMIICLYIPRLMRFFLPIMIACQVIPVITFAPFFIILLGVGPMSKIVMAAVICYFPIFISFATGIKLINSNVHELLTISNASKTQSIRLVLIPLALPSIMAGLKIASTLAVIGAIVGEFSGAELGLGRNLFITSIRTDPELMMSSVILAALLGAIMFSIVYFIEKKLGKWYLKSS